jgi:AbrB family looped-hinge helix DNA binding protein
MRVTTKGQVTIPQEIRDRLGIQPGAEVDFEVRGDNVRMKLAKRAQNRGRRLIEHLKGRGTVKMTTDEIMALTRQPK